MLSLLTENDTSELSPISSMGLCLAHSWPRTLGRGNESPICTPKTAQAMRYDIGVYDHYRGRHCRCDSIPKILVRCLDSSLSYNVVREGFVLCGVLPRTHMRTRPLRVQVEADGDKEISEPRVLLHRALLVHVDRTRSKCFLPVSGRGIAGAGCVC